MSDLKYIHKTRRERCIKGHLTSTSVDEDQLLNMLAAAAAAADFSVATLGIIIIIIITIMIIITNVLKFKSSHMREMH